MLGSQELRQFLEPELVQEIMDYIKNDTQEEAEVIQEKIDECIKYLYLVSKYQKELSGLFLPVEQEIDDVWHFIILQTREYQSFCDRLPGKVFLHHRSIRFHKYTENVNRAETIRQFLVWIPLYVENFGPFTASSGKYWKIVKLLNSKLGIPFEEMGNRCQDL